MKTIAVIGLGPSGLVATKELKQKGFHVVAFDGQDRIGGVWTYPGEKHGVYKELFMNSSRAFTEYSDFPWNPEDYPDYVSTDENDDNHGGCHGSAFEFRAYLEAYAKHFQLTECFQLETRVLSIEGRASGSGYNIQTQKNGETTSHEFDAVVICTGRDAVPNNPLKETTFKDFFDEKDTSKTSMTVIHSQQVKNMADYDGKRVLIVGACVSGSDISARLAERGKCKTVVNSVRTVPYHMDKYSALDGRTFEEYSLIRLVSWMAPYMPSRIAFEGLKQVTLQHNPDQLSEEITGNPELVPDKDMRNAFVGFTKDYMKYVKEGKLIVKPEIDQVDRNSNTVAFKDGTKDTFDVVILSTGYKGWDLSILPKDIRDDIKHEATTEVEPALYNRCLVANVPDMAFIGLANIGAITPVAEILARYVAAVFNEDIQRPTESKIAAGVEQFRAFRDAGRFNRYDITTDIQEMVGYELGVIPTMKQAMWNPSELLFGPMYPCYYRTNPDVDDENVVAKAKERYAWCKKHPMIRTDA